MAHEDLTHFAILSTDEYHSNRLNGYKLDRTHCVQRSFYSLKEAQDWLLEVACEPDNCSFDEERGVVLNYAYNEEYREVYAVGDKTYRYDIWNYDIIDRAELLKRYPDADIEEIFFH